MYYDRIRAATTLSDTVPPNRRLAPDPRPNQALSGSHTDVMRPGTRLLHPDALPRCGACGEWAIGLTAKKLLPAQPRAFHAFQHCSAAGTTAGMSKRDLASSLTGSRRPAVRCGEAKLLKVKGCITQGWARPVVHRCTSAGIPSAMCT